MHRAIFQTSIVAIAILVFGCSNTSGGTFPCGGSTCNIDTEACITTQADGDTMPMSVGCVKLPLECLPDDSCDCVTSRLGLFPDSCAKDKDGAISGEILLP